MTRLSAATRAIAATALFWTMWPAPAYGASLQVSPVRLDLPAGQPAGRLTLRNTGTTPIRAQVRVYHWTQSTRGDHLAPTQTLVASPPIVQIAPGGEQLVRVVLVKPPAAGSREQTYRLLIDELPDHQPQATTGVTIQLRYSVPVFANTPATASSKLQAGYRQADGKYMLVVHNTGTRHAQLSATSVAWAGGRESPLSPGLLGYALGDSTRMWPLPAPPSAGAVPQRLRTVVNGTPMDLPLTRLD